MVTLECYYAMQNNRIKINDKSLGESSALLLMRDRRINELADKVKDLDKESKITKRLLIGIIIPICIGISTLAWNAIEFNCNTTERFTQELKSLADQNGSLKLQYLRNETGVQRHQRRAKVYDSKPINRKSR